MRKFLLLLTGLFVGVIASLAYFNVYLSDYFVSQSEFEEGLQAHLSANKSPEPPSPSPDFWQDIVSEAAINTVAIESFSNNKLVARGNGIVVANDGLILTAADVVPNAAVYQVTSKEKITKAEVVYKNVAKNISFLKVQDSGFTVASFASDYTYKSGTNVILTGKAVELSKLIDFSQRALINYILERDIILDTNPDNILNGAKAMDASGRLIGMTYVRNNKVHLINSTIIGEAISEHLSQKNKE